MFTGLVTAVGKVVKVSNSRGFQLQIQFPKPWIERDPLQLGESIAVNGACLTVVDVVDDKMSFDLSPETLDKTVFSASKLNDCVNLERALKVGDRLGGHFVLGHVDGVADVISIEKASDCWRVEILLPQVLMRYVVEKGSIVVHGVSLTVNRIHSGLQTCELMLIPHTWENTHFSEIKIGQKLHIEVDFLAKHLERLQSAKNE